MAERYFYSRILGLICSVFDAYSAVLFLQTKKSKYKLVSWFSLGDNVIEGCVLEPGHGLVGWIIRNNQPLLINDFDRQGDCLGYYTQEAESTIKAFMGCPFDHGEGVLCLDSKKTYSFSHKDQKILHQFVQLIQSLRHDVYQSLATDQERRFYVCLQIIRSLRKRNPRWSSFLESFLQTLSEYTHFDYCLFASRDETGSGYYLEGMNKPVLHSRQAQTDKFDINEGLIGWVFRNHTLVSTMDRESNRTLTPLFGKRVKSAAMQSVICLPLIVHMRTRGVLTLASERHQDISQELIDFLILVADHLSLFLENLYLKNKLRSVRAD